MFDKLLNQQGQAGESMVENKIITKLRETTEYNVMVWQTYHEVALKVHANCRFCYAPSTNWLVWGSQMLAPLLFKHRL